MNLKQRIAVTRRGYAVLKVYCPGLIRTKVVSAALEALSPFVTVWFSARIINEIAGTRKRCGELRRSRIGRERQCGRCGQ